MRLPHRVLCVTLAVVAGCSERPGGELLDPGGAPPPDHAISDAVHDAGNPHFFWLPPMVGAPAAFNAPFDGTKSPVVRVCVLPACTDVVAEYTTTSGPGGTVVQVSAEEEHYSVAVNTDLLPLVPGPTYRIVVLVAGTELGFADIQLAETAQEARNLSTGELIGLKDGRTIPVKFRLEAGAVFPVTPDGGVVEALDGIVTMDFPDGALAEETGITVERVEPTDALVEVEFGPEALAFLAPVPISIAYSEADLNGTDEADLALNLRDALGRWAVMPGSEVFPDLNHVSAPFFHFSHGGVHTADLAIFCPGDADSLTFDMLEDAIDAVVDGGTVEVCPGTHTVQFVEVFKTVTIRGAAVAVGDTLPTLTTAGARHGLILNGSVTVRDLRMVVAFDTAGADVNAAPLLVQDRHDQVLVEDVELVVASDGVGALIRQSSTPGATATLTRARVSGGTFGVRILLGDTVGEDSPIEVSHSEFTHTGAIRIEAFQTTAERVTLDSLVIVDPDSGLAVFAVNSGSGAGPRVDVRNSSISGGAVWYTQGASGVIQNNSFSSCHPIACVRVIGTGRPQPEPVRILDNAIAPTVASATHRGIWVTEASNGPFEVNGNDLTGVGVAGPDRPDSLSYSFIGDAIFIESPSVAGEASGNTISSANYGIGADSAFTVTGRDNTITAVRVGVRGLASGFMNLHFSDLTDYLIPIAPGASYAPGSLTCNWWGDAGGPIGVAAGIGASVYTPFATTPVAGTGATTC